VQRLSANGIKSTANDIKLTLSVCGVLIVATYIVQ
jgi:hypothetical protein